MYTVTIDGSLYEVRDEAQANRFVDLHYDDNEKAVYDMRIELDGETIRKVVKGEKKSH